MCSFMRVSTVDHVVELMVDLAQHLDHYSVLYDFEDSDMNVNVLRFFPIFIVYIVFLNKKQVFFRPAPVSYKRGYHFRNRGLVFLKFMFLMFRILLYIKPLQPG